MRKGIEIASALAVSQKYRSVRVGGSTAFGSSPSRGPGAAGTGTGWGAGGVSLPTSAVVPGAVESETVTGVATGAAKHG